MRATRPAGERGRAAWRSVGTLTAAALLLSGCGAANDPEPVATQFLRAASTDPETACALLTDRARSAVEQSADAPCRDALPDLALGPTDGPLSSTVAGHTAQVRVGEGAVFLSLFDGGWRIIAAGCTRQSPDTAQPYECEVDGT